MTVNMKPVPAGRNFNIPHPTVRASISPREKAAAANITNAKAVPVPTADCMTANRADWSVPQRVTAARPVIPVMTPVTDWYQRVVPTAVKRHTTNVPKNAKAVMRTTAATATA